MYLLILSILESCRSFSLFFICGIFRSFDGLIAKWKYVHFHSYLMNVLKTKKLKKKKKLTNKIKSLKNYSWKTIRLMKMYFKHPNCAHVLYNMITKLWYFFDCMLSLRQENIKTKWKLLNYYLYKIVKYVPYIHTLYSNMQN